ncbi:MAG TPA: gliding motility-associated C-terminal domain-containing protein, partial [Chitinophagales bacterium]|nr:gliding motility-associated C-terminal domain-containing protein [Chitinophagales bacterium]
NGTAANTATFGTSGVVSVTVTDAIGCVGSTTMTLSEQSYLTPSIVGDLTFCENSGTTLQIGESYADYIWSHGDNNATSYLSQAGTYTVTVSDDNGCTGSGMVTVAMNELPEVSIGGATLFNEGGSTQLFGNVGMTHYQWSTGDTTDNIHLTEGGVYSLLITDDNGCTNQTSVIVTKKLFYDLVIPNAFSPNDDDVNDVFKVRGYHIEDFTMRIHDRWGNTLFETQDPTSGWMGQRNKDGSYYEMGTYVYAIWVRFDNGKEQTYRGNLTLIR